MKIKLFDAVTTHKKSQVGIDIGSHSVKAIELSQGQKGGATIKNIGYAKIEGPATKENQVRALKEAAAQAGALNKDVAIAVSGPSVIVRFIELPQMSDAELRNAITFEAEKYIPFSINDVIIDYKLLVPQFGANQMLVLLVAAKKDFIAERLGIADAAGLSVSIIDVTAFASANSFLERTARKGEEVAALVDIGAKAMDISIIDGDILYFTRNIQLGGDDITKVLSEALSIDLKGAEAIKINPAAKAGLVKEKTQPILHNIVDEIRLSFSYFENQSGKNIGRAYLAGGSSRMAGLYDIFTEGLGVAAVTWDPAERIEIDTGADAQLIASIKDQLGVAIGLALR